MLIPVIKVKDKASGTEHVIGTSSHDMLYIKNGSIHYLNRQCFDGTNGGYEFIGEDSLDGFIEIEMWDIEDVIELARKDSKETAERRERLEAKIKQFQEERKQNRERVEKCGIVMFDDDLL